jgi:hypothetical protein
VPRHCGGGRRRNGVARTRSVSGFGFGFGFGFAMEGAAAFLAAFRAASRASCVPARSFAPASTVSAGVPSRAMRVGKSGLAVDRCHFPAAKHAKRVEKRPAHSRGDLVGDAQCQGADVLMNASGHLSRSAPSCWPASLMPRCRSIETLFERKALLGSYLCAERQNGVLGRQSVEHALNDAIT